MVGTNWKTIRILAGATLLFCALLLTAADTAGKKKGKKKGNGTSDPPRTSAYMTQLRSIFDAWDTDKDTFLDKKELAVAFRGVGARPFDYKKDSSLKTEDKDKDAKKDDKDDKKDSDSQKDKTEKPEKKPDYSKYPDYNFLVQLDQDKDEKISRDEFLQWARDYAVQLRDQADAQKKLLDLQKQLQKAGAKSKNRKTLQNKVRQQQQQINKLQQKMRRYAAIQNRMKKN